MGVGSQINGVGMDSSTVQQVGGIALLLGIGAYNSWQSRQAAKQTKATGNGFAKHVRESLARIERKSDATHDLMVEHLADHAGSDLSRRSVS